MTRWHITEGATWHLVLATFGVSAMGLVSSEEELSWVEVANFTVLVSHGAQRLSCCFSLATVAELAHNRWVHVNPTKSCKTSVKLLFTALTLCTQ